jgi:hypothetical protein
MKVNNNGADVCYNVQTAIDQKNKLLVDYDVINNAADQGNLYEMAKKAKETLGVEEIKALADKGYYSTLDLKKCEKNKIETYVAKPKNTGGVANPDFHQDRFQYDQEQNIYICPAGQTLYPGRIRKVKGVEYQDYKNFRACKQCKFKDQCTSSKKGRTISRNLCQGLESVKTEFVCHMVTGAAVCVKIILTFFHLLTYGQIPVVFRDMGHQLPAISPAMFPHFWPLNW